MPNKDPDASSTRTIIRALIESAQAAIAGNEGAVIITSPYLTGDVAQIVTSRASSTKVTILTTFRAENFACGASSLDTLKALIERGVTLRHLDDLHAKIITTSDTCFVGSHNLTLGALRNKEATLVTSDSTTVRLVIEIAEDWISSSSPITSQMIEDMEKQIGPLIGRYNDLRDAAEEVDQELKRAEKNRQDQERRRREEQQLEDRRRKIREALQRAREVHAGSRMHFQSLPSSTHVPLTLQRVLNSSWISHETLMAPAGADLTTWWVDGEQVDLTKRQRYLVIIPEIGRLGWPALNRTRLTRFGTDLELKDTAASAYGEAWDVLEITLNQQLETLTDWNVSFELGCRGLRFTLMMIFDLKGLKVTGVKSKSLGSLVSRLTQELASNDRRLNWELQRVLINPFKYKSNSRGVSADYFCEGLSDSFLLSLKSQSYQKFFCLESN